MFNILHIISPPMQSRVFRLVHPNGIASSFYLSLWDILSRGGDLEEGYTVITDGCDHSVPVSGFIYDAHLLARLPEEWLDCKTMDILFMSHESLAKTTLILVDGKEAVS